MPQIEDGYTRIANEILENIMKVSLNGTQFRIVMAVWRYTYGFQRKEHDLSLSFLSKATGASKSQVDRELSALIDRKIIAVVGAGERGSRVVAFNKNHDEWTDCTPRRGLYSTLGTEVYSTVSTEPYSTSSTKKEKIKENKKETRQRQTYAEDSTYFKMAAYFHSKIKEMAEAEGFNHASIAKADLQKWADEFRKLVELDKVEDKHLIRDVIDWVTADSFWKTVVLSAKKLREKFGELALKMRAATNTKQPKAKADPRDKEIAFQEWVSNGNDPDEFDWS